MPFHADMTGADVHLPITYTYADATARNAATGFVSGDLGKFAWQQDDNSIWMLTATTPTWVAIGGSGGIPPALANASFLCRTTESSLSNESNLGALTTGLLKITVAAGTATPSTGSGGTDFAYPPDGTTLETNASTTRIKAGGVGPTELASTAVTPGSYGDGTHTGAFTVDADGRLTAASSVTITGAAPTGSAGGDLTGTYPNPTIGTNKVTVSQMAQAAAKTVLGNPTASTANVQATTDPVVSGNATAAALVASGLTGATAASRYCGATTTGAPASGTFAVGDFVIDQKGLVWVCISAGSPGTFFPIGPTLLENHQTGTSYGVVLADAGYILNCDNGSAFTLTFPANGTIAFPVGTQIDIYQGGAGQVTVALTTDTLHAPNGTKLAKQYSRATMWKQASTVWVLSGDTTT